MRVIMLSPCPFDSGYGGVQKTAQLVWETVASSPGTESRLVCYGAECGADKDATRSCNSSKLGTIGSAWGNSGWANLILVWHVDLLRLVPFLRPGKARVVLFLHGVECWKRLDMVTRKLLSRVDFFLSNSEFTWQRFLQSDPRWTEASHRTVALGLDKPAGDAPLPDVAPAALMVGRMDRGEDYKGHRQVIAAWPLLIERLPEAKLWVVGGGDLAPELKETARSQNLDGSVHFWGAVTEDRKHELLQRCRCLALPSSGEGFGLVYLEAMRLGRPCLVSTLDAGLEVVAPPCAGLAVERDSPAQVADALYRLMNPTGEWQQWSQRARQRYESAYTGGHFQRRLINALSLAN